MTVEKSSDAGADGRRLHPVERAADGQALVQSVYEAIRDAIADNRFRPRDKLVQLTLSDELGVSRTPVREALNRLTHEGVVRLAASGGYLVNDLSDSDITHVFEVREQLEVLALRTACGALDRVQQARAHTVIDEMSVADPTDAKVQFDLNRRFHQLMVEPCPNHFLLMVLDQVWEHPVSRRITTSYIHGGDNVARMVAEHRAILEASIDADLDRLVSLTVAHMTTGYADAQSAP